MLGSTFFLIKDLLDRVPTLDFLAVRFAIAAVVMLVLAPRAMGRPPAIIMSTEPVFASLFAVWLGGEDVTSRLVVGGSLVLGAMLAVELAPRRTIEGEVPHIAV